MSEPVANQFSHLPIREEWLLETQEAPIEADVPIIDAHHHLWDRPTGRYLYPDLRADMASGHRVLATVFVQSRSMYRTAGPEQLRPLGEVEFANGVAAMADSGVYGDTRACAGIVGCADMTLGRDVGGVIEAMSRASGRLRGVRFPVAYHADPAVQSSPVSPPAGLLATTAFRDAGHVLADHGLSLDIWAYQSQLGEVLGLARAVPGLTIIVDHCGGPLGVGPFRGNRDLGRDLWLKALAPLAEEPNVFIKLGGLAMKVGGFDFHLNARAPSSTLLAEAWAPYFDACIALFGTRRCMFESNFPVDKSMVSYANLWNAFKAVSARWGAEGRNDLLFGTAQRVYHIDKNASKAGMLHI